MKKEKTKRDLCGKLMRPIAIGKSAIFTAHGQVFHTSRVVALHEMSEDYIHFETLNTHYHLSIRPFPQAVVLPIPASLAACA